MLPLSRLLRTRVLLLALAIPAVASVENVATAEDFTTNEMDASGARAEAALGVLEEHITPPSTADAKQAMRQRQHEQLLRIEDALGPMDEEDKSTLAWWCNQTNGATGTANAVKTPCLMWRLKRVEAQEEKLSKMSEEERRNALHKAKAEVVAEKHLSVEQVEATESEEDREATKAEEEYRAKESRIEALERYIQEMTDARAAAATRAAKRREAMTKSARYQMHRDLESEDLRAMREWFCASRPEHMVCRMAALAEAGKELGAIMPQLNATQRQQWTDKFRQLHSKYNVTEEQAAGLREAFFTIGCANETFRATSVCAEHRTQLDYRQAQGRVREWFCKQQGKGHEKYAACKRIALMNAERELRVAGVRSTPEEMQARFAKISLAEEEEARQVHEIGSAWCAQSEEQYSPFCLQWRAKAQEEAREL